MSTVAKVSAAVWRCGEVSPPTYSSVRPTAAKPALAERLVIGAAGGGRGDRHAPMSGRRGAPLGLERGGGLLELEPAIAVAVPRDLIDRVHRAHRGRRERRGERARAEQADLLLIEERDGDRRGAARHLRQVARDREHDGDAARVVVRAGAAGDGVEVRADDDRAARRRASRGSWRGRWCRRGSRGARAGGRAAASCAGEVGARRRALAWSGSAGTRRASRRRPRAATAATARRAAAACSRAARRGARRGRPRHRRRPRARARPRRCRRAGPRARRGRRGASRRGVVGVGLDVEVIVVRLRIVLRRQHDAEPAARVDDVLDAEQQRSSLRVVPLDVRDAAGRRRRTTTMSIARPSAWRDRTFLRLAAARARCVQR